MKFDRPEMSHYSKLLLLAGTLVLVGGWAVAAPAPPPEPILAAVDSALGTLDFSPERHSRMAVIDYDASVLRRRLWVVERSSGRILLNAHVSHAQASGIFRPMRFSNLRGSNESSRGAMLTVARYAGEYGSGLRLAGLDTDLNDAAFDRAIVVHPSPSGWPVWSHGCFTMTPQATKQFIDLMEGGQCLFVHSSARTDSTPHTRTVRVNVPPGTYVR